MPFLLFLKPVGAFLKAIPWQVYASIALLIVLLILRSHWIGVGVERCQATQAKAQAKALAESAKQEKQAPVIAKEAQAKVQIKVQERIKYVQKYNTVSCDEPYSDKLQQSFREAATAADSLR